MTTYIGLDFETKGKDLPKIGLKNYVYDVSFGPLIASVAFRNDVGAIVTRTFELFPFPDTLNKGQTDFRSFYRDHILNGYKKFTAHHANFERTVLNHMGYGVDYEIADSAVFARMMGADSQLENAAPQLLGIDKMEVGKRLIKKFSLPDKNGKFLVNDPKYDRHSDPDWQLFQMYCEKDAELSLRITELAQTRSDFSRELDLERITSRMNWYGWLVNEELLAWMEHLSKENADKALADFRASFDPNGELNLNSLKQLKAWTRARGVAATSFDEDHVNKLITRIQARLDDTNRKLSVGTRENYHEVLRMLQTKKLLGGASLKKLPVIRAQMDHNYKVYHQYMHVGAGQSYRTTGVGIQMQNLKRLPEQIGDTDMIVAENWNNDQIAENLRQLFRARNTKGALIVGDFSSVESRGLAWMAGEDWKIQSYKDGKDMYKVLATQFYTVVYDDVTKAERAGGKLGELACGYGAGADAVSNFAEGIGMTVTPAEAGDLVTKWRKANPKIVNFWGQLDNALHDVVERGREASWISLDHTLAVSFHRIDTPKSLSKLHQDATSVEMKLWNTGSLVLIRTFHGCYVRGRNICYYKPSGKKLGDLWAGTFRDKKTNELRFFNLYGGKLAGILTQSFCREIFFDVLSRINNNYVRDGLNMVGQFHDEIIIDYNPRDCYLTQREAEEDLKRYMSDPGRFNGFPLSAEVKSDFRYIK